MLDTPASSTSEHYRFNIAYEKQRKRQLDLTFSRTAEEENEIRRLNDELRGVEQQLKKVAVRADPKRKKELADVPYEIKRTLPTGVILRSSLLALPQQKHALSAKLLKKLQLFLDEMGVPARPMPTKPVCETFDKLRQDAVGLLSLRKHLKSKQNEVQALRERYHALTGKEYKPITTPVTLSGKVPLDFVRYHGATSLIYCSMYAERPGDAALPDGSSSAASAAGHAQSTISKGALDAISSSAVECELSGVSCVVMVQARRQSTRKRQSVQPSDAAPVATQVSLPSATRKSRINLLRTNVIHYHLIIVPMLVVLQGLTFYR